MLVSQMGIIVRISRRNLIRFIKAQLKSESPLIIEHFGGKDLGYAKCITDYDEQDFQSLLEELVEDSRSKKKKP